MRSCWKQQPGCCSRLLLLPCVLLCCSLPGAEPAAPTAPWLNLPAWGNSCSTWFARSSPSSRDSLKHRGCTRALCTRVGGSPETATVITHIPPAKQFHPLAYAQPLPADGVLGVLGSSPCTFCTSKFYEMLVLNLCVRISDFSKAGVCQCFIRMMCRTSSILPRSRKKDTE